MSLFLALCYVLFIFNKEIYLYILKTMEFCFAKNIHHLGLEIQYSVNVRHLPSTWSNQVQLLASHMILVGSFFSSEP